MPVIADPYAGIVLELQGIKSALVNTDTNASAVWLIEKTHLNDEKKHYQALLRLHNITLPTPTPPIP